MNIIAIVIWAVLIGLFVFILAAGNKNKKKYAGQSMDITEGWYEFSQSKYEKNNEKKSYYFEPDKHFLTQGHLMVDKNHNVVYEATILYGNMFKGYEVDFINHVIDYKHHHKMSATKTTGMGDGNVGIDTSSYFKFDGEKIWQYLENLGFDYHLKRVGLLAFQVEVMKDNENIGTIYSSNGGKNYFNVDGPIEAKAGGNGFYVVECADKYIDILFLYAIAFARTELSLENMK